MSPEVTARFAVNTLLSGPAGAPMAGQWYGDVHGIRDLITVDMGGTSFDACLIKGREPAMTTEGHVGGHRMALPVIDIHTVGAGGGSIAYLDSGGFLHVGPASAGADPGPACYGRGGSEPTVTDADLALGYIDPDFFLGGEIKLDRKASAAAIEGRIAGPLGLSLMDAAFGIYRVINSGMAAALRVVSVEKGYDPREFALVVAGGAGPLHACAIARELDIPMVLIPRESSVFCAAGMLLSDLKHDYVRTFTRDLDKLDSGEVNDAFAAMEESARAILRKEGVADERMRIEFSIDLRYIGQHNEVEVPVSAERLVSEGLESQAGRFHAKHDALYGYAMPGAPVELINLRVKALGATDKPRFESSPAQGEDPSPALKGYREAFFDGSLCNTPIYDGMKMGNGNRLTGPAIIEQPNTTIVVAPGYNMVCDAYSNYLLFPQDRDVGDLVAALSNK